MALMCFINSQRMVMMYFQTSVTPMKANKASDTSDQQWSAIGQAQEISIAAQVKHNNNIIIIIIS